MKIANIALGLLDAGAQLHSITSLYGMKWLISESTNILQDSSCCIDSILTNQPNIVMDSGAHSSLHSYTSPSHNRFKSQFKN